jgi:bacterioferritin-associated ferredoxin
LAKTIVCHCEDISLDDLFSALEQGYNEIESIKRFTGIGTGKCQGKCCVIQTLRVLDGGDGRKAVVAGAPAGPGTPLTPLTESDLDAGIRMPTIRQPVMPLKIDDIVAANDEEESE